MIVTFDNLLDGSELYFAKEVVFEDKTEITEIIRRAREILDKYNLNFVRFRFRGSWYLTAREKEKEE